MKQPNFLLTFGVAGGVILLAIGSDTARSTLTSNYISPFGFIFFYIFACLVTITVHLAKNNNIVYIFILFFFTAGLFEFLYPIFKPGSTTRNECSSHYFRVDEDLGYTISLNENAVSCILHYIDGPIIYSAKYSFDENGLRRTLYEDANDINTTHTVYFFGGSFTFGEGVNDKETLPQIFSKMSGYRSVNFGLQGYGPHQMLRALETELPRKLGLKNPQFVVYTSVLDSHIMRAAGRAPWDQHGPRYEVVNDDTKYFGRFDDSLFARIYRVSLSSHIYNIVNESFIKNHISEYDVERFLAIILRSRELILTQYNALFIVILWDLPKKDGFGKSSKVIAQKLTQYKIPFIQLSSSLEILEDADYYFPMDGHPNARAYELVARTLKAYMTKILEQCHLLSRNEPQMKAKQRHSNCFYSAPHRP